LPGGPRCACKGSRILNRLFVATDHSARQIFGISCKKWLWRGAFIAASATSSPMVAALFRVDRPIVFILPLR
jgi:hypothetical protein